MPDRLPTFAATPDTIQIRRILRGIRGGASGSAFEAWLFGNHEAIMAEVGDDLADDLAAIDYSDESWRSFAADAVRDAIRRGAFGERRKRAHAVRDAGQAVTDVVVHEAKEAAAGRGVTALAIQLQRRVDAALGGLFSANSPIETTANSPVEIVGDGPAPPTQSQLDGLHAESRLLYRLGIDPVHHVRLTRAAVRGIAQTLMLGAVLLPIVFIAMRNAYPPTGFSWGPITWGVAYALSWTPVLLVPLWVSAWYAEPLGKRLELFPKPARRPPLPILLAALFGGWQMSRALLRLVYWSGYV